MLYSSADNQEQNAILSLKEMIGIIVVFGFVLYLLFPKGNIEALVQVEQENTHLSINYLESMLLYHPDSVDLKMLLIKNYRYKGAFDKASQLNSELIATATDQSLLDELYKQEYLIIKEQYFQQKAKNHEEAGVLTTLHTKLLNYYAYTKGRRDYLFFFAEATQMDFTRFKYTALKGLIHQRPDIVTYPLEEQAFYLAITLNHPDEAYAYLQRLIEYPQLDKKLLESALSLLFERGEYDKAAEVSTKRFLKTQNPDELFHLFNFSLYALQQNPDPTTRKSKIASLIRHYQERKDLGSSDIYLILHTLLQSGDTQAASNFAIEMFTQYRHAFNPEVIDLAIQTLQYTSNLDTALEIAYYAYGQYLDPKWLDAAIRIASWLGEIEDAARLNRHGYLTYHTESYQRYILERSSFDMDYPLLGEIYQKEIDDGNMSAVADMAEYFYYTGEIDKAESYFTALLEKHPSRDVHKQAMISSYDNNHYPHALELYQSYQKKYGTDPFLDQLAIELHIAQHAYHEAYPIAKRAKQDHPLQSVDKQLIDMASLMKDYDYLYRKFWSYEKADLLYPAYYYHLITLEQHLSKKPQIEYLYQKAWDKSQKRDFLMALLYYYMDQKAYDTIQAVLEQIPPTTQAKLEKSTDYLILLAHYYDQTHRQAKAYQFYTQALEQDPYSVKLHQAYLWFLIDTQNLNALRQEITALRRAKNIQSEVGFPAVVAAHTLQMNDLALKWLKPLLTEERDNQSYQQFYTQILATQNQLDYGDQIYTNRVSTKWRQLSDDITLQQHRFAQRWHLYRTFDMELGFQQRDYRLSQANHVIDNSLALSLQQKDATWSWSSAISRHFGEESFNSASLDIHYQWEPLIFGWSSHYHQPTELMPQLQLDTVEDQAKLGSSLMLTQYEQLGLAYAQTRYHQHGQSIGEGEQLQLSYNRLFRTGYPDIQWYNLLSINRYRFDDTLPFAIQDFNELTTQLSIGHLGADRHHHNWQPFGTIGLSINDRNHIGTSLSLGIAGMPYHRDQLRLLLDYYKGVGLIDEASYGMHLEYRF